MKGVGFLFFVTRFFWIVLVADSALHSSSHKKRRSCEHAAQVPAVFGVHSVHQQSGGYSSCYTETGTHSVVVQKTVEIPQLQFLDLVVVSVSCNDKFWYRQCRKLWNEDLLRPLVSGSHLSGVGLA